MKRKTLRGSLIVTFLVQVGALCSLASASCGKLTANAQEKEAVDTLFRAYTPPTPPATLQEADKRALWYVTHFWDNFDFYSPQNWLANRQLLERTIQDLVYTAVELPPDSVAASLVKPIEASDGELLYLFADSYARLLYNEGSAPKQYEAYYLPILKVISTSSKVDIARSERAKFLYKALAKNRPGSPAQGFLFTDTEGRLHSLKSLEGKEVLMIFFDPGCDRCRQATQQIEQSITIRRLVTNGSLVLLYLYPYEDEEGFRSGETEISSFTTYYGYNKDGAIGNNGLYTITQTPSIYLLDSKGIVMQKETSIKEIEEYFNSK